MEITTMTFVTLSLLLVAMVCGICTLLSALYDHDHPNERNDTSSH